MDPQDKHTLLKGLTPEDPWDRCHLGSDRSHVYILKASQPLHKTPYCQEGICCANPQPMTGISLHFLIHACPEPKAAVIMLP